MNNKHFTESALLEIQELQSRAESLARGGASDRMQAQLLQTKIKRIEKNGCTDDEMRADYTGALLKQTGGGTKNLLSSPEYRDVFLTMLRGDDEPIQRLIAKQTEKRDLLAGQQSIFYTAGIAGGYTLPIQSETDALEAVAAYDPLLSAKVCDFKVSDGPFLQPTWLNGWDLSTITSQNILEGQQQLMQTVPTVGGRILRSNNIHRFSLGGSFEAVGGPGAGDGDVADWLDKYTRAAGVAFARGLGKEATTGNGSTQAQGLFTALGPAAVSIGTGTEPSGSQAFGNVTGQDLLNLVFSLNRAWRAMPKCAFLCADREYFKIRNASDNQSRPLISIVDGQEMLFNRPLYVSPSLGSGTLSSLGFGPIIFGDLSQFHIRVSKLQMRRSIEHGFPNASIDKGEAAFISIIRMDSALTDFSNGVTPPVVWGSVTTA